MSPIFARLLCDHCDDGHILLDRHVFEFFTKNYKKKEIEIDESSGFRITSNRFFQDLGKFYVKHKKPVQVYNYCNTKGDSKLCILAILLFKKRDA